MYLFDTNVISEIRKGSRTNFGVKKFFQQIQADEIEIFLSVITIGELRRGIEIIRHRGDTQQAQLLENWFDQIVGQYFNHILEINTDICQLWGKIRAPNPHHALDKLIAATAIVYDLTVVTRNTKDFAGSGVKLLNPFED